MLCLLHSFWPKWVKLVPFPDWGGRHVDVKRAQKCLTKSCVPCCRGIRLSLCPPKALSLHRASGVAEAKRKVLLSLNWELKCPQTKTNVVSEPWPWWVLQSGSLLLWVSQLDFLSQHALQMQFRIQITSFSAKNIFPFAKNSAGCRECLYRLLFCQYFPQRRNNLQRFCNLFCPVRITACSAGFVIGLRLPHGQHLDGPMASSCLTFEVLLLSRRLPGWPLDAAYKGLFYQADHTGTRPKYSLIVCAIT